MEIADGVRASNHDRERAVAALSTHAADGRLTFEEFEQRVDHVYRAVTTAEVDAVLHDLPAVQRPSGAAGNRQLRLPVWLHAEWRAWLGVGALCVAIWLATSLAAGVLLYPWPMWVIGPWGAVLLARSAGPERALCARRAHRYQRYNRQPASAAAPASDTSTSSLNATNSTNNSASTPAMHPGLHLSHQYRQQWLHALGHRSSSSNRRAHHQSA